MDILEHRLGKYLHCLLCQGLPLCSFLGAGRPHGHRAGHAVGDAGALDGLLIRAQHHIDAAAGGGDIHGVAHGVLDIVSKAVFIAGFGNQNRGLDFVRAKVHLSRREIKFLDGQQADPILPGQLHNGVPSHQGGSGVGAGNAVAGVAADGAGVADLGTADGVHRLPQHIDVLLDDGVPGDMAEAGERPDADILLSVQRDAPHAVDTVDRDELLPGPFPLPHLHQHVGTAGDDLGLGVLQAQAHRILDALRLVEGFHIIHSFLPPFSQ